MTNEMKKLIQKYVCKNITPKEEKKLLEYLMNKDRCIKDAFWVLKNHLKNMIIKATIKEETHMMKIYLDKFYELCQIEESLK